MMPSRRSPRWLLLLLGVAVALLAPSPSAAASSSPSPSPFFLSSPPPPPLLSRNVPRAPPPAPEAGQPGSEGYVCRPFGECEPCPKSQRNEPFCQPYGNRRLLHCVPRSPAPGGDGGGGSPGSGLHEKELPAWEACGKVVLQERQDYWEFVTANVLFLLVGAAVLLLRTRRLAALQYRELAARIGLPSSTGGGGGEGSAGGQRNRFLSFSL